MIPINWRGMNFCLKNVKAKISVKMGVMLLRTPATALGSCVCPKAYRIAGMPLPHNPITQSGLSLDLGISFHLIMSSGKKARNEIPTRAEATSNAV